jgi:hypothetical protein
MVVNSCLFACALVAAQPADRTDWLLVPRLSKGQELVYRGTYAEEALGNGVQFNRSYRLEGRVFVLDTLSRGLDVAFYTVLKQRHQGADEREPGSVRLEVGRVDLQGRVTGDPGVSLIVPLEGPATIECGVFVELPKGPIGLNENWEVKEENRPPRIWRIVGTELVNGTRCLKLQGLQQSSDWDQPRADRTAWRRQDTVWLAAKLGVAYKVERKMERREPAHQEPTQRSFVRYELQSNIQYPGQLFEDRKRDILQVRGFTEALAPLLPDPTKYGPRPFDAIEKKIGHYLDSQPPTPYRDAVLQVKRRVEAARRGESPPVASADESTQPGVPASVGHQAPDFVVANLLTRESAQLRRLLGHPILMVFYAPKSLTVEQVLGFAQAAHDRHLQALIVLGFAVSGDVDGIRKQHADLKLSFPILSGQGLRQSYGVDATPKLVIVDGNGIVRASHVGWGPETAATVNEEIQRCLDSRATQARPKKGQFD